MNNFEASKSAWRYSFQKNAMQPFLLLFVFHNIRLFLRNTLQLIYLVLIY